MPTLTAGTHELRLTLLNNTPLAFNYLLVIGTVGSMRYGAQVNNMAPGATATASITYSSLTPGTYPVLIEVFDYYAKTVLTQKLEDVFIDHNWALIAYLEKVLTWSFIYDQRDVYLSLGDDYYKRVDGVWYHETPQGYWEII